MWWDKAETASWVGPLLCFGPHQPPSSQHQWDVPSLFPLGLAHALQLQKGTTSSMSLCHTRIRTKKVLKEIASTFRSPLLILLSLWRSSGAPTTTSALTTLVPHPLQQVVQFPSNMSSCKCITPVCLSTDFTDLLSLPGLVCNRTFDLYACWPDGLPGTTVNVSCPWFLPWYHKGLCDYTCLR